MCMFSNQSNHTHDNDDDIANILNPGQMCTTDTVERYLKKQNSKTKLNPSILYLKKGQNKLSPGLERVHLHTFDALQSKLFYELYPNPATKPPTTSDSIEETVYALMCFIFTQRLQAKAKQHQTIVVQACHVRGNHTIGFAFNTRGECAIIDGLGYKEDDQAVRGFQRACQQFGIKAQAPHKFTPAQDKRYRQFTNGCVLVAAKMLAKVSPELSIAAQATDLGNEMAAVCQNEIKTRHDIFKAVTTPEPDQSATLQTNHSTNPTLFAAPAVPAITVSSFFIKPQTQTASKIQNPLEVIKHLLNNPKYKCEVTHDTKSGAVKVTQERYAYTIHNEDIFRQKNSFSFTDNGIEVTSSGADLSDYYLALSAAIACWPGQKLVIANCSAKDIEGIKRAASSYIARKLWTEHREIWEQCRDNLNNMSINVDDLIEIKQPENTLDGKANQSHIKPMTIKMSGK